jgi:hypothetical protein
MIPIGALSGHRRCLEQIATWEEYRLESDHTADRLYPVWKYEALHNLRGWLRSYERTWPCLGRGTCGREEVGDD